MLGFLDPGLSLKLHGNQTSRYVLSHFCGYVVRDLENKGFTSYRASLHEQQVPRDLPRVAGEEAITDKNVQDARALHLKASRPQLSRLPKYLDR